MALVVYNTLTRKKEPFVPLNSPKVNFYACGVTVYDLCHLGHARSAITFDVVYRYLTRKGYQVNYVRNFTDVDDKIIKRAAERGEPWDRIAETYILEFYEDMDALGVRRPTHEPRATQYIPRIIEMVQALVKRKHAYVCKGDVYYSVQSFAEYGKLSHRVLEELEAGARVAVDESKKDPADFALWKASKPGEPAWDSPWGMGRPGWHIECSAMSTALCGPSLDIHGGGQDLVFPHHENEIAQSEGATGRPFVKYWLHNGFVKVNDEKMSKSLGNFFTIREIRRKFSPEAIRHFLLGTHYRNPVDFADQYLVEAEQAVDRLYAAWEALDRALAGETVAAATSDAGMSDGERETLAHLERIAQSFEEAMDDDFNTARAIGHQFELVKVINTLAAGTETAAWPMRRALLARAGDLFHGMNEVLGSLIRPPAEYRRARVESRLSKASLSPAEIEALIARRDQARRTKDWAEADRIRDELAKRGVVLRDGKDGTTWSVK